jgi:hypothetical protein
MADKEMIAATLAAGVLAAAPPVLGRGLINSQP